MLQLPTATDLINEIVKYVDIIDEIINESLYKDRWGGFTRCL